MASYVIVKFSTTKALISDILTLCDGIFDGLKGLFHKCNIFVLLTHYFLNVSTYFTLAFILYIFYFV